MADISPQSAAEETDNKQCGRSEVLTIYGSPLVREKWLVG
jgi:hypothetical protein